MVTNAPYYQMRSGQFASTPSSTNAMPSHMGPEDDDYDPSVAADVALSHERDSAPFHRHTVRQTSVDAPVNTLEESHNLAELLEAATTAAGQAAQAMDAHDAVSTTVRRDKATRKRVCSPPTDDVDEVPRADVDTATKRRRIDMPTDPQLQSTQHGSRSSSKSTSVPLSGTSLLNDARAAGVHSAAALFRRTSEKTTSRKYTRPPMSKLFMSLQLSPENFLQLQAQAKSYMLDTTFPERQNCVGNRGKGDTDMVKLRLFNCVRDFLNSGAGEQFFGENVEKPGEKDALEAALALGEDNAPSSEERLAWPRDGNKIISLVTPLMRRMVTNERQRMYAIETRKGGSKKRDKEGSVEAVIQQGNRSPSHQSPREEYAEQPLVTTFDPTLGQVSQTSPLVSSPITPTPVANMALLDRTMGNESLDAADLLLPTDSLAEPRLSNINVFLVTAGCTVSSNVIKPGIKIDQKRISSKDSAQLTTYSWEDFLHEVVKLLKTAKARYPEIRERILAHHGSSPGGPTTSENPNVATDNLRELAAAANAMQGDNVVAGIESHNEKPIDPKSTTEVRTSQEASTSTSQNTGVLLQAQLGSVITVDSELTFLPRYTVKTVGPSGWEYIESADQWTDMLLRRSQEVWADGVVNMIIEMADVPVGAEKALRLEGPTVGKKDEAIAEDGLPLSGKGV